MANAVRKTISMPAKMAREIEKQARAEGKTLSAIVQDSWREARAARSRAKLAEIQRYWSGVAKSKGIFTERDLERYLSR
jgi:hypothetical protein